MPRYFSFIGGSIQFIAALVVRNDTNADGQLDCGDEALFEITSLSDDDVRVSDRVFIPDNISQIRFDDQNDQFVFSEVLYTDDNVSIRSIRMSLNDLAITETFAPDLLSKARAAYNQTNGE
jgi:prolyl oligopeptidase PreP (S9A serine peptidase family)